MHAAFNMQFKAGILGSGANYPQIQIRDVLTQTIHSSPNNISQSRDYLANILNLVSVYIPILIPGSEMLVRPQLCCCHKSNGGNNRCMQNDHNLETALRELKNSCKSDNLLSPICLMRLYHYQTALNTIYNKNYRQLHV